MTANIVSSHTIEALLQDLQALQVEYLELGEENRGFVENNQSDPYAEGVADTSLDMAAALDELLEKYK